MQLGIREILANKVHLGQWEKKALKAREANKEPRVGLEMMGLQVNRVGMVSREEGEKMVMREPLVLEDQWVNQEKEDNLVTLEKEVNLDHLDRLEFLVKLDQLVKKDQKDLVVHRVQRDRLGILDHMDLQDQRAFKVNQDFQAQLEDLETKVHRDQLESQELQEALECRDRLDNWVHLVCPENLGLKEKLVKKALLAQQDRPAFQALKAFKVSSVQLVTKAKREKGDLMVFQECKERQGFWVSLEILDHLGHQVHSDQGVIKVLEVSLVL